MTDQEIYELLLRIDNGYRPTDAENCELASIERITWSSVLELPANMKYLDNITVLDLSNTGVSDIRSLSCLRALMMLNLQNTKVSNIRTLSDFMALISLDLGNTNVSDIHALSRLRALKSLSLRNTSVNNIRSLSELTALIYLDLCKTVVSDIRALSRLTSLENLDLHDTRVNDIRILSKLTTLEILDLQNTRIIDVSPLAHLSALKTLNLGKTRVSDIHPLSELRALKNLSLNNTNVSDLCSLSELKELTTLNLEDSKIEDISALAGLKSLIELNLCGTKVSDVSVLSELKTLYSLNLSNTKVKEIRSLSVLQELKTLCMGGTIVSDISALSSLKALSNLDLSEDENLIDISPLSNLTKLTSLNLKRTHVSDISALSGLTQLKNLDLRELRLDSIPEFLLDLELDFKDDDWLFGQGILIQGLKLNNQPIEIFSQDRSLIRAYYRSQEKVPINECKVIFLGDAEAGKTHSIKRLLKNGEKLVNFDGYSTPGIEITVSSTKIEDTEIVVNYWDFGGQEIQHSMHRMFLTERTVYVVFLNARQDPLDDRARYWLEIINSFASGAPILLVINKIDQNDRPKFNEEGIRATYKDQIKDVVRMSALYDEKKVFLEKLQGSINKIIKELPTASTLVPKSWKLLLEDLRNTSNYYLTTDEFKKKCISYYVKDYDRIHDSLADLFQVIGVSFSYYQDRSLSDYMLLNPKWLVNALYTIVTNSNNISKNGVITQKDLYDVLKNDSIKGVSVRRVIPELRYTDTETNYIMGVIRSFHLSYQLKDGSEFFPMLCDGNEKISVDKVMSESALHYIFLYTFLPSNVMHRLIVDMQSDIDYKHVWYSGAVLRNEAQGQIAYIHYIGNKLHIYVDITASYFNPNEYLTPILNNIRGINQDMGLQAEELVGFTNNGKKVEIPFDLLLGNLNNGIEKIFISKDIGVVDIRPLLSRYDDFRPKLFNSIIEAIATMQHERSFYESSEETRNRFITQQLRIAGYYCFDQLIPGGLGTTKTNAGEIDIAIKDNNYQNVCVVEGLNLQSLNKPQINNHLNKLLVHYNEQGFSYGFLVVYLDCSREKYRSFIDKYMEYIKDYTPDTYNCVSVPVIVRIPASGQFLTCIKMNYECGGTYYTVYHLVVRIANS